MLQIDHYGSVPLHYQIEQYLRGLIAEEDYKNGKLLPTEVEFSEQFGTSRNTVRQAINKLVSEGLLLRRKGVGTIVIQHRLYSKVSNWFSFTKEMESLGMKVKNYEVGFALAPASLEAALFFKIPEKTQTYQLERLRGNQELPFVYFISFFNPSIPFTGAESFDTPLYKMLEEKFGIIAKSSYEELRAIRATPKLAAKLNVPENDPILYRRRLVYDKKKMPVEYNLGYYIGEKFSYILESERRFQGK
jgi:GntR family transcriptional regulator